MTLSCASWWTRLTEESSVPTVTGSSMLFLSSKQEVYRRRRVRPAAAWPPGLNGLNTETRASSCDLRPTFPAPTGDRRDCCCSWKTSQKHVFKAPPPLHQLAVKECVCASVCVLCPHSEAREQARPPCFSLQLYNNTLILKLCVTGTRYITHTHACPDYALFTGSAALNPPYFLF